MITRLDATMNSSFVFAVSTLVGTIVGLGMFGIPYTAARAGFFIGIGYIVVLGVVMLLLHLMYGEVVERTKDRHRLAGYAERYLGEKWKSIVGTVIIFSVCAGLLAYIVVGGKFLSILFSGSIDVRLSYVLSVVFWFVLSLGVWRGVRTVAKVELLMTGVLVLFVFVFFMWGAGDISFQNLPSTNFSDIFLPYGVVLFALSGVVAIPEIREIWRVGGGPGGQTQSRQYKKAIIWGSIIPAFLYIAFTFLVVGVSGENTSQEALGGLAEHLGAGIVRVGAIFGILAIATSYLALGISLRNTFEYDWHVRPHVAAALVTFAPLILFLIGLQQFIGIISFSGAVFEAATAIVLILVYQKAVALGDQKPGYSLYLPKYIPWGLMALFAGGGVYEIIYLVMKHGS